MTREEALEILDAIADSHDPQRYTTMWWTFDLAIEALREQPKKEGADEQLDSLIDKLAEGNMSPNEISASLKEQAQRWYLKGFEDAETTERQPVTPEQTMRDAETHFHFVWDANAALREQPAPEQPAENDLCSVAKRVADGMVGIGGIPDKDEFYAEFASRLWDALGIQPLQFDGSEMIGEEPADEYLDRLVKKASPAWQGVDPQQFLDEVRGRVPAIEWKPGPPDMSGTYLIITRIMKTAELYDQYDPDDSYWDIDEVLFHIGPIPKTPDLNE